MTGRSEVERILDVYLADGPERVADRVVDAALAEIDTTMQRPAMRVPRRITHMRSITRLVLAATLTAVAAGGVFLFGGGLGPPADPSPPPTVAPSSALPSSAPTQAPAALQLDGVWGGVIDGGEGVEPGGYELSLGSRALARRPGRPGLDFGALTVEGQAVRLTRSPDCPDGATYAVSQSTDVGQLTFGLVSDSCAARIAVLTGPVAGSPAGAAPKVPWVRVLSGPLVPGARYHFDIADPQFSLILPARMRGASSYIDGHVAEGGRDTLGWVFAIDTEDSDVAGWVDPRVYPDPCIAAGDLVRLPTLDALVEWYRSAPITVSDPEDLTVAGRSAVHLSILAGADCAGTGVAPDLTSALPVAPGLAEDLYAVEAGPDQILVISTQLAGPEDDAPHATDLVNSLQFR